MCYRLPQQRVALTSSTQIAQEGKVTELMSKDLLHLPGKEGLMI